MLMEELLQIDQYLFYLINTIGATKWLDFVLPLWRHKLFWLPFYVFLGSFLLINFGKKGLMIILMGVLTIAIADTMSSQVIKKSVKRIRPCNDVVMSRLVNLKVDCGGGYSFTSSHATNHFALAFFLMFSLGRIFKWIKWPLLFWAASIAYGQVYVGVHYPTDVIVGALLGMFIGVITASFYQSLKGFRIE